MIHLSPGSIAATKKPSSAYLGKFQPIVRYLKYNPLDSDHEFSTTQNSSRTSRMEVSTMSKEVQSANSMALTKRESKQADHPRPILAN